MKFADAEQYFLDFETDLPNEAGGIPIGMYLAWLAQRQLLSADVVARLAALEDRGLSWADLLFELCDGKLYSADLNEQGLAFTDHYYLSSYLSDYIACLGITDDSNDGICRVPETRENLAKVSALLDQRWSEWKTLRAARPAPPPVAKPTVASMHAALMEHLLPVLQADGFEFRPGRADELVFVRRRGIVDQQFRIGIIESNERVALSYWFRFGCSKLREVWLWSAGKAHRTDPPALYRGDFCLYPDLEAQEWNLTQVGHPLGGYFERFKTESAELTLALYRELLKPALDKASSARALAEIAQTSTQMTRQRNHLGHIKGIELLGRIALFGAYTRLLSGTFGEQMRNELLAQWDRGGVYRQPGGFPIRADIEYLLDSVVVPGFAENARAFLEAST